jgi:hypothetical protein
LLALLELLVLALLPGLELVHLSKAPEPSSSGFAPESATIRDLPRLG